MGFNLVFKGLISSLLLYLQFTFFRSKEGDSNQSNVDNLNNLRRDAIRHLKNKKKMYWKFKIDELETNSKIKNIQDLCRGINGFKKGYQPRTNIVRDEKGDLVTDCHSIVARWRNHFSQLFNVHGVSDVRQTERHTAEPQVPLSLRRLLKS